jgi:membrane associated rhomboid family serine protease
MLDEFKNAFQRHNNAHVQLIIINVVVFVFLSVVFVFSQWFKLAPYFLILYDQFSIPSDFSVFLHRPWTLFTYFFTHTLVTHSSNQILHLLFNMITLYWFGRLFVEYLGSDKLIAVYILGGISGAVIYLMAYNLIPNPPEFLLNPSAMVGASAAIYAVMAAIATLLPDYTFLLMFIGPVKLKYIAAASIFLSFLLSVSQNAGGEIAHLGGALMGFVYTKQLQSGINWGSWITTTLDWFKNLFRSKPKVKVTYRKSGPVSSKAKTSSKSHKASQEEIDAILDKISDHGYESLTKEEKEKLFNASKK